MIHHSYELLTYLWLILALLSLCLEMATPGFFFFLSFTFGCLAAAVLSYLDYSLAHQLGGTLLATISSLIILIWAFRTKNTTAYTDHFKSNTDALIGKKGIVTHHITPYEMGTVKINGELWAARATDTSLLNAGIEVEIVAVKGAHVIVKRLLT